MNENKTVGMTFFDGLLLLLIALKFCGVITWQWWQVIGLPFALVAAIIAVGALVAGIVALVGNLYLRITTRAKD